MVLRFLADFVLCCTISLYFLMGTKRFRNILAVSFGCICLFCALLAIGWNIISTAFLESLSAINETVGSVAFIFMALITASIWEAANDKKGRWLEKALKFSGKVGVSAICWWFLIFLCKAFILIPFTIYREARETRTPALPIAHVNPPLGWETKSQKNQPSNGKVIIVLGIGDDKVTGISSSELDPGFNKDTIPKCSKLFVCYSENQLRGNIVTVDFTGKTGRRLFFSEINVGGVTIAPPTVVVNVSSVTGDHLDGIGVFGLFDVHRDDPQLHNSAQYSPPDTRAIQPYTVSKVGGSSPFDLVVDPTEKVTDLLLMFRIFADNLPADAFRMRVHIVGR